jgi:serine/threonine-protein kinase
VELNSDTQLPARNSDSLAHLRGLFDQLIDLPPAARGAWLAEHVVDSGEHEALLRLLQADDAGDGFLDTPATDHAERLRGEAVRADGLIGQRIGAFRLIRLIGRGGMAAVFLAEREDAGFSQQVAVKLLRRGLYSDLEQRLFLRERQVLANLTHPNIARLFDGGVTGAGIPYLVMEYVDGESITEYAAAHSRGLRDRLDLFLTVCRAVEAAHRALIVHRDIKPSNILVSADGAVKLLDFGIAKLLDDDVENATVGVFTPDYAAPEQIRAGAITTATDIYALGVLLHELLLGVRPRGEPLQRPSTLAASNAIAPAAVLRGDLDNILLKALEAEPDQRYASADAFAADIKAYLSGQAVAAHPPSRWYRARKFVGRHRGGVATTAAFALAVLAALGLALWQAGIARDQARRANAMRDFMFSAFAEAEPSTPRAGPPSIAEVVERAISQVRSGTQMNADVRSELLTQLGGVLAAQGQLGAARENLQWNYTEASRSLGANATTTLAAGRGLVDALSELGEYAAARELADRLLAQTRSRSDVLRAQLLLDSATLATRQRELRRAEAESRDGLRLMRSSGDQEHLADALGKVGNVQLVDNDYAGAIATFQELLAADRKAFGPAHVKVATDESNLSRAYRRAGDPAAAESHIRAALAIDAATLPRDHWHRSRHLNALTMLLLQQRDYRGALDAATESLRIDRIAYGDDKPETANDLNSVGMLHGLLGDFPAALAPLHEALQLSETNFGAEHYETAITRANYGAALAHAGDARAGAAELRHALASLDAAAEPDRDDQAATVEKILRVKFDQGEFTDAAPLLDRLDALLAGMHEADAYWNGRSAMLHATQQLALGQYAQASSLLATAAQALQRSPHPDALMRVEVPLLQAEAAARLDDHAAAALHADEGLERLAALRNPPARLTALGERARTYSVTKP